MKSNSVITPEISIDSITTIQGDWKLVGVYTKTKSILNKNLILSISDNTINYKSDSSFITASYQLFYNLNSDKCSLIQLDVNLDFHEVYLLEYFDKEFMVLKRYAEQKKRAEKKLTFHDYYFLARLP